ncbi:MAG: insulinase family protein [Bacteroidia bacterium]|nr:insulinase family protein [Bacteroidia bacterium]
MKKYSFFGLLLFLIAFNSCRELADRKYRVEKYIDKNGYHYETVTGDPLNARIYTLGNGLKVFLTINKNEPRLQTYIAVKAGSIYDPKETTGLAHYLEHMMFKGSSKFGTRDWEKEKVLLDKLSELYELHRKANNPEEKKAVYAKIDSVSAIAATIAVANEYDKMTGIIGAKGTNAYTSEERTVYINDIPSNELEKWLTLEKERFSTLVLRLFHTELETVYEEFNMGQDDDDNKSWEELYALLFKKHPYGTQTVIGKAEHLKNPSMINIHNYWNTYYVPNNMAIALSGDLDFDKTIKTIDNTLGQLKRKEVNKVIQPKEDPIEKPREKTVLGPNPENVLMAFRFAGDNSYDKKMVTIINGLLYNGKAGLIDLDLVQKQKILSGWSYYSMHRYYSEQIIGGVPRQGQKLEDVKALFLEEIKKIKNGFFEDWMIEAVINNMKLQKIRQQENNQRAHAFVEAFTQGVEWKDYIKFLDELGKVTKQDIMNFAKKYYADNYAIIYKRIGKDPNVVKVDKPGITPVPLNRDAESAYFREFKNIKSERLTPVFVDFEKDIARSSVNPGTDLNYIKNSNNELFSLQYILDMGKNHDRKLQLAFNYLPFLGTNKYSPYELQKELFKYGLYMSVNANNERSYISISGLKKSFEKGVEILEHVISSLRPDQKAYNDYVDGILKDRADQKLDKNTILWQAMYNYGKYGSSSPFTNILSKDELKQIKPNELTNIIKDVFNYRHRIFYFGQTPLEEVKTVLEMHHKVVTTMLEYPRPAEFTEMETEKNNVYFVNYDMVQANIILIAKDQLFTKEILPMSDLFNEYYGGNMASIVFQEIRESKALAYSAYSFYDTPNRLEKSNYTVAYVATQVDKLKIATEAMLGLMNDMPRSDKSFNAATEAILKRIESERIINAMVFWTYQANLDRGILYDIRKDTYEKMKTASIDQLAEFFDKHVKDKKYTFLILGNKHKLDIAAMEKLGKVKQLSLDEIFNY